jgi:hypothetical protein
MRLLGWLRGLRKRRSKEVIVRSLLQGAQRGSGGCECLSVAARHEVRA